MSNGYTQPFQSLNSTAKLIQLPKKGQRSKSVSKNYWTRLFRGQLSPSTTSDEDEIRRRKSDSSSTTSNLHQDLNSTIIVQDNANFNPNVPKRSSRSNSRSSEASSNAPIPTPRSSIRGSISDSDRNSISVNNQDSIIIRDNPSHKTRTTVTVHLSKSSKTSSTPNLLENFEQKRNLFEPNTKNKNESLSQSLTNIEVNQPVKSESSQNGIHKLRSPRSNRLHCTDVALSNDRINLGNFSSPSRNKKMIKNSAATESNNRCEDYYIAMDKNGIGKKLTSLENNQTNGGRFISSVSNRIVKNIASENNHSKSLVQSASNLSLRSSQTDLEEVPKLNSFQVFRQPKYKDRNNALRRAKQLEHLNQNDNCNEIVNQLAKGIEPNYYENHHPLNVVDFINREGFVTTTKTNSFVTKQKKQIPHSSKLSRVQRDDPIYSDIRESRETQELLKPNFQKKVSFKTFHEPIQEGESFTHNKKILPGKFCGIVQVIQPLRSRTDEERTKIASLCYNVILEGSSRASKLFGNVDNSRWGEIAYVLLTEKSFEVRDSEGFLMARHQLTDVSVIHHPEDDPNVFVYIGRCKFNGRIGVALRLNKIKSAQTILNAFNCNK